MKSASLVTSLSDLFVLSNIIHHHLNVAQYKGSLVTLVLAHKSILIITKKIVMTATVAITGTEPTPIVKDFDTFVTYIKEKSPALVGKKHLLPRGALSQLKKAIGKDTVVNREFLKAYFTLFCHLAQKGNLFVKTSQVRLKETERLTAYTHLTAPEKYFYLLKTFWVDADWGELLNQSNLFLIPKVHAVIGYLARKPKIIPMKRLHNLQSVIRYTHYFLEYLSFFGVIKITCGESSKISHNITSAAVTEWGGLVFPLLHTERALHHWNIPYLRETTEQFSILPGLKKNGNEPFFKPFQGFVNKELQPLPRYKGTFTLKVSLKDVWRTIVVSSEHTLKDVHCIIQDAFAFDRDHLYAFFTDGVPWSNAHIYAPDAGTGPFSDQVSLGDLKLVVGQSFLYIFDFGDKWQFKIEVLDVNPEPGPPSPLIRERKGDPPEQYL